ncbi:MAG: hypothetical protein OZSIB_3236 [Candidatus Ozemobacter sibiricus]|jgi:hypothetical protein|uniref:DUF3887 domain-containing protein n=1 Tax=Candidatus Ozemobacter sibiricus TaxID=2268124 RepID=A0A367ZR21_9BACT|nr:MAG: hypothetical protein OZSIB_3236 [Candidatus Ozemobacter sibiricus]
MTCPRRPSALPLSRPLILLAIGWWLASGPLPAVAQVTGCPLETVPFAPVDQVKPILETFFANLATQDVVSAARDLFAIFPISQEAKDSFANKITAMKGKLGNLSGSEFIGFRRFGVSQRYVIVYWFSFHDLMPVLWEFSFYRPKPDGPWQLNFIRFESDDLLEFMAFPKLQYDTLRMQLEGPPKPGN